MEFFEKGAESGTLLWCTGVLRVALLVKSSFIADADGVSVMVFDVGSYHGLWSTFLNTAITTYYIMIADAVRIATGAMPFVDLLGVACLVRLDGRAVDD